MKSWSYYREKESGDYLLARNRSRKPERLNLLDAVGTMDEGDLSSIEWDMVTQEFLRTECDLVAENEVPDHWRSALRDAAGLG